MYSNFEMMFPHNDECFNGMRYEYDGREYLYMGDKYLETAIKYKKDKLVKESEISTGITDYVGYHNFALDYPKIQHIYRSQKTLLCRSGMLSMTYVIWLLRGMGYRVFCDNFAYFEIVNLCSFVFGEKCIVDIKDKAFQVKPHCAYIYGSVTEDGTVYDSERIAKLVHGENSVSVCDNTLSSVFHINPIKQGADIVVDSTSKYFTGDSGVQSALIVFNEDSDIFLESIIYPLAYSMGVLAGKKSGTALNDKIDMAKKRFRTLENNARVVNCFLVKNGITTKYPNVGSVIWITGINVNCYKKFKIIQPNATFGLSHTTYSVYWSNINDKSRWWLRLSCGTEPPETYAGDLNIIVNAK